SERILRAAFKAGYARVIVWRGVSTEDDQPLISAARRFGSRVTICSCDAEWQAAIDTLPGGTVATAIGAGTLVSPALLMEAPAIAAPPGQPRDVPAGGDWRVSGVIRVRASDARNVAALAA